MAAGQLPQGLETPDVIVVDPPRAGLSNKAMARIGEVGAPRIVYVSCNPATLGPNAAQFRQYGYRLEHVTPVDMFPHTPHVECVALLTREEGWEPDPALASRSRRTAGTRSRVAARTPRWP